MAAHVILCIFNQGCSAAKFIFSLSPVVTLAHPLRFLLGRGGVWGGGTILACQLLLISADYKRIEALMGLFATNKAIDRLSDGLKRLADDVADLQRDRKKLDLEFTDLYDKVRHQMSRMAKRDALASKANGEIPPISGEVVEEDELDPISAKIHARRTGGFLSQ